MADELLGSATQGEGPAPKASDEYPLGRDPLELMRALRLRTRLVVYPAVTALIPLSHFLLGTPWMAALVSHAVGGYLVATLGIEFGFWYGWRLRKEAAYPTMLAVDLGATGDFACACERAVLMLAELLGAEKVALAWRNQEDGSLTTVTTHGIAPEAMADATSPSWWQQNVNQAMDGHKVVVARLDRGHPWQSGASGPCWVAHVPLLSLDKVVGLLILVGGRKASDLRDKMLLSPIGLTIGLALDNLHHTVELRRRTDEYVATTNLTGDVICRMDKHARWTFVNDAACQFYGKTREELLDTDSRTYTHPEDRELTAQAIRQLRAEKKPLGGFVNRQVTPMGSRVVEWNGYPLFDEESHYAGIQITGRDITERKQMEQELRQNEARLRLIAENATDVIWTTDLKFRYTYVSPSVTRMRGYPVDEVMAGTLIDTLTPRSLEIATKVLAKELGLDPNRVNEPFESRTLELELNCKDGSTIWTEVTVTFLRDEDDRPVGLLGISRDISERRRAEEERARLHAELEVRAITDGLTGLYNHAHFYQRLPEEIERAKRYSQSFAVVMMDVDNFKRFNDSRGHQAGDEMLRRVADSIRSGLRRSDLAFRYGGDEFAAILPHANSAKARAVVSRINRCITKTLHQISDGATDNLALSAGIAHFPDDGTTADDLVRTADAALYSAKWVARARRVMVEAYPIESLAPAAEAAPRMQTATAHAVSTESESVTCASPQRPR